MHAEKLGAHGDLSAFAINRLSLLRGLTWNLAAFGTGQVIRLVTSVFFARLPAPDLSGIVQIVFSLQIGLSLLSDLGVGQNIVYSANAEHRSSTIRHGLSRSFEGCSCGSHFRSYLYRLRNFIIRRCSCTSWPRWHSASLFPALLRSAGRLPGKKCNTIVSLF
jgi:hypothetical protein